jgi:hypothetical protein
MLLHVQGCPLLLHHTPNPTACSAADAEVKEAFI